MSPTKKTADKKETTKKPVKKPVAAAKKVVAKKVEPKETDAQLEKQEAKAAEAAVGGSFIASVGRRKTSIARVRLLKNGKGLITVNGKPYDKYFTVYELRKQITEPLEAVGQATAVDVSAKVHGGGIRGQAEAIRLGIARCLLELNPTFRKALKKEGYLTRDSRKKERKKFGLKRARRAPQWSKR